MVRLHEYLDARGCNEYRTWFNGLDVAAATKVTVALERLAGGNTSSIKPVGEGVSEYKTTSAQATEFISARMVIGLSSCLVAAQRNDRTKISRMPRPHGASTNSSRRTH
jgi:putative component of toxin-antitoxin plasmid stabilization module